MAITRSADMWLVAYALARCGEGAHPPAWLDTKSWKEAYGQFWPALGDGRTRDSFARSLKNARDTLDPYVERPARIGWRAPDHSVAPPRPRVVQVLESWAAQSNEGLCDAVLAIRDGIAAPTPRLPIHLLTDRTEVE